MAHALLVALAAALTGATALAAELLWIRGVGRAVGAAPTALASVVAFFLAGLGAGAWLGGRAAAKSERPAKTAAILLLAAGIWVAVSPLLVGALPDMHAALRSLFGIELGAARWTAPFLSLFVVLVPALLLGAVFPFLVRFRVHDLRVAARRTGMLYASQTVGSAVGVLAVVLALPAFGEAFSLRIAGTCALGAALILLVLDRPLPHGSGPPGEAVPGRQAQGKGPVLVLFVGGAIALGVEMAWFRILLPLTGSHTLGSALLLGIALLGFGLGSLAAGWFAPRLRRCDLWAATALAAAGCLSFVSLPLMGDIPARVVSAHPSTGMARFNTVLLHAAWAMMPAALCFGAIFPLAFRVRADWTGQASRPAGRLFAWNAAGNVVGSLLAATLLLPLLGAERTLLILGICAVATAAYLRLRATNTARALPALLTAGPLLILLVPGLLADVMQSGPTLAEIVAVHKPLPKGMQLDDRDDLDLYAEMFCGRPARDRASGEAYPVYQGVASAIELFEEPGGTVGLRRGVLREARFDADDPDLPSTTETALGLLPALLHEDPKRALVVGHGAGWTAEAVLAVGVPHVAVVEIDPALFDAVEAYRGHPPAARRHRAAHIVAADGREVFRQAANGPAERRYDVIASQPSHPWSPVSSHMFTAEAYQAAHDALTDDGVMAQWLQLFDMTPELLQSAVATFRSVFPELWAWQFESEIILIGFRGKPRIHPRRWNTKLETGKRERSVALARRAGLSGPGMLLKHFVLDAAGVDRVITQSATPHRDDVPALEFELARRRLRGDPDLEVHALLFAGFPPNLAALVPDAKTRDAWIAEAVNGWLQAGDGDRARAWDEKFQWGSSVEGLRARARVAFARDAPELASNFLKLALTNDPKNGEIAAERIGALEAVLHIRSRDQTVRSEIEGIARAFPNDGRVLAALARAYVRTGAIHNARIAFEGALAATGHPAPPGTGLQYARLLLSASAADRETAREAMMSDPTVYEDADALDLAIRLMSLTEHAKQAEELEHVRAGLEAQDGLRELRRAQRLLARHDFEGAARHAEQATERLPQSTDAWELRALVELARAGAAQGDESAVVRHRENATSHFRTALDASTSPAARERALRMLGWYGQGATLLDGGASPDDAAFPN